VRLGSKWTLGRLVGGCGVDSADSGWGPLSGCPEFDDEPSGFGTTELVIFYNQQKSHHSFMNTLYFESVITYRTIGLICSIQPRL
jgi:hypothetical protein